MILLQHVKYASALMLIHMLVLLKLKRAMGFQINSKSCCWKCKVWFWAIHLFQNAVFTKFTHLGFCGGLWWLFSDIGEISHSVNAEVAGFIVICFQHKYCLTQEKKESLQEFCFELYLFKVLQNICKSVCFTLCLFARPNWKSRNQ